MSIITNQEIRAAALAHCYSLVGKWGDAVPASELKGGFKLRDQAIHLMAPQGIFTPQQLTDGPLTIRSALASRYTDEDVEGDQVRYVYAIPEREHDNAGMKRLIGTKTPLIYLKQVQSAKDKGSSNSEYMIIAPVYVTGCDDAARQFLISAADVMQLGHELFTGEAPVDRVLVRKYRETTVRARLHQAHFRKQVLAAYATRCAVCEIRVRPLLDGAHILADSHPEGEPVIQNGISMCSLHHRAFDRSILQVTPEYKVQISQVQITKSDEAAQQMLVNYEGKSLWLPRNTNLRPNRDSLKHRLNQSA